VAESLAADLGPDCQLHRVRVFNDDGQEVLGS